MCILMNNKNIIKNKTNRLGVIAVITIVAAAMIASATTATVGIFGQEVIAKKKSSQNSWQENFCGNGNFPSNIFCGNKNTQHSNGDGDQNSGQRNDCGNGHAPNGVTCVNENDQTQN